MATDPSRQNLEKFPGSRRTRRAIIKPIRQCLAGHFFDSAWFLALSPRARAKTDDSLTPLAALTHESADSITLWATLTHKSNDSITLLGALTPKTADSVTLFATLTPKSADSITLLAARLATDPSRQNLEKFPGSRRTRRAIIKPIRLLLFFPVRRVPPFGGSFFRQCLVFGPLTPSPRQNRRQSHTFGRPDP